MKRVISLLLAVALAALLCACGGKTASKSIDLDALGAELSQSAAFSDTMTQQGAEIASRIYGFDEAAVKKAVLYTGTGATAEEIFLAEAADAKGAEALKTACEDRIEHQKQAFQNYVPEELVKLDDAVLRTEGSYVLLVVSGDSAAIGGLVDAAVK